MSQQAPGADRDRAAAEAVVRHHAQLAGALDRHTRAVIDAADGATPAQAGAEPAGRAGLLTFLETELLPHAHAEEETLYRAAAGLPGGEPLITGMRDEHVAITALVRELSGAASPVRAAAAARALAALFAVHLAKENDLILPLVLRSGTVSLADLLAGMHELLGGHAGHDHDHAGHDHDHAGHDHAAQGHDHAGHGHALDPEPAAEQGCGCGGCGCGGDSAGAAGGEVAPLSIDPRLDVRTIPHSHRHATVLQALDAVAPGRALVLVAPHAPNPVLGEVRARYGEEFSVQWLQAGPDVWQVRLERTGVHA